MAAGLYTVQVTINASQSLCAAPAALNNCELVRILMPAAWTAAALTFQTSQDGATFQEAYDNAANEVTVQTAASRNIEIPWGATARFQGVVALNVRSGTVGTPVAQAAAATLTLVCRPYF